MMLRGIRSYAEYDAAIDLTRWFVRNESDETLALVTIGEDRMEIARLTAIASGQTVKLVAA